jgi:uncharacterized protein (TIGR01244 family)
MIAIALALLLAPLPTALDPAEVPGYVVASPSLAVGGAPTEKGLDLLKEAGVRTIVDIRAETEAPHAPTLAVGKGFRYFRIPVTPATLSEADVEAIEETLGEKDAGLVYLHCASGNRTGGIWALLRARAGDSHDAALEEGERVGLKGASMKEAVQRMWSPADPE